MIKPPVYCQNAIPTAMGWQDPVTKRIVAPVLGLLERIKKEKEAAAKEPELLTEPAPEPVGAVLLTEPAPEVFPESAVLLTETKPTRKKKK